MEYAWFGLGGQAGRYVLAGDLAAERGRHLTGRVIFGRPSAAMTRNLATH